MPDTESVVRIITNKDFEALFQEEWNTAYLSDRVYCGDNLVSRTYPGVDIHHFFNILMNTDFKDIMKSGRAIVNVDGVSKDYRGVLDIAETVLQIPDTLGEPLVRRDGAEGSNAPYIVSIISQEPASLLVEEIIKSGGLVCDRCVILNTAVVNVYHQTGVSYTTELLRSNDLVRSHYDDGELEVVSHGNAFTSPSCNIALYSEVAVGCFVENVLKNCDINFTKSIGGGRYVFKFNPVLEIEVLNTVIQASSPMADAHNTGVISIEVLQSEGGEEERLQDLDVADSPDDSVNFADLYPGTHRVLIKFSAYYEAVNIASDVADCNPGITAIQSNCDLFYASVDNVSLFISNLTNDQHCLELIVNETIKVLVDDSYINMAHLNISGPFLAEGWRRATVEHDAADNCAAGHDAVDDCAAGHDAVDDDNSNSNEIVDSSENGTIYHATNPVNDSNLKKYNLATNHGIILHNFLRSHVEDEAVVGDNTKRIETLNRGIDKDLAKIREDRAALFISNSIVNDHEEYYGTMAERVADVESLDDVESVNLDDDGKLHIITKEINTSIKLFDEYRKIGCMDIVIDIYKTFYDSECIRIRNRTRYYRSEGSGSAYYCGHVPMNGAPCFGDSEKDISSMYYTKDLLTLVATLIHFIKTPNESDDWGEYMINWPVYTPETEGE